MQAELITTILEKFSASTAAELDFHDETCHLILRKESALLRSGGQIAETLLPPLVGSPVDTVDTPVHLTMPVQTTSPSKSPTGEIITSPIVATFYASPGPDSPPFVNAGTKVKAGDTLCILEAMKMMNHLEAEFDCEILTVHTKSGDMVEFGQTLFEVKRL
jgi:acetyl-CoA carboxylase biotin carboxyl carrier protein